MPPGLASGKKISTAVVENAQQRQQIFDVGCFQVLQPPVFHEGDIASGELELQPVAVVTGPKKDSLLA